MSNENENVKNKVVSGLIWKFAETFCADGISFVISVILARLLAPEDYGEISLINVFITIASVFVVNGLGTSLIQKREIDDIDSSTIFYANIFISVILYFGVYLAAPLISSFYELPHLTPVLRVLGLKIPFAAVLSILNAFVSREMDFKKFFFATLIGTVISGVIGIYMAFSGYGVWALVVQVLVNHVIDAVFLFFTTKWTPKAKFSFKRLKPLFSYGWKLTVSQLLKVGSSQLNNLLIGKVYSSSDLAYYSKGEKYPELITTGINSSIQSVLFPALSKKQDDLGEIKDMTKRSMTLSVYLMSPFLLGMAAISYPLISWMLTEKWLSCVPYLVIFCINYSFMPVQTSNLQGIRAIGRSDVILRLDILKRSFMVVSTLVAVWFGPLAIAIASLISCIFALVLNMIANKKYIGYGLCDQFIDLLKSFYIALIMAIIVAGMTYTLILLGFVDWLIVIIGILSGGFLYLVLSVLFKNESFLYLIKYIKKLRRK